MILTFLDKSKVLTNHILNIFFSLAVCFCPFWMMRTSFMLSIIHMVKNFSLLLMIFIFIHSRSTIRLIPKLSYYVSQNGRLLGIRKRTLEGTRRINLRFFSSFIEVNPIIFMYNNISY